jgi:hypothetical protein
VALTPFSVAVIVVAPFPVLLTRPPELMVATAGVDEVQVTCGVRLKLEPSLKYPVALNC